jgi:hypothetical protein
MSLGLAVWDWEALPKLSRRGFRPADTACVVRDAREAALLTMTKKPK